MQLKNAAANASEAKTGAGIYFLENSVKKDAFTPENKNFGYYRLPYAKVYTTYTPNEVWKLEDGKLVKETNFQKGTTFFSGGKRRPYLCQQGSRKEKPVKSGSRSLYLHERKMCIPCVVEPSDCYS